MAPLVWLVTGTTSGIGAALVSEIVARGDKVIASGRRVQERIGHLQSENVALLELDITADFKTLTAKVIEAWAIFGRVDVLMNNAGMSALRTAEEAEYVTPKGPCLNSDLPGIALIQPFRRQ